MHGLLWSFLTRPEKIKKSLILDTEEVGGLVTDAEHFVVFGTV